MGLVKIPSLDEVVRRAPKKRKLTKMSHPTYVVSSTPRVPEQPLALLSEESPVRGGSRTVILSPKPEVEVVVFPSPEPAPPTPLAPRLMRHSLLKKPANSTVAVKHS